MSQTLNHKIPTPLRIGLMTIALSLNLSAVNAATLTPKIFLSGEILDNSAVFDPNTLDFDRAIAEIFTVSVSELDTSGDLLMAIKTIEDPTSPQASLDWNKVANSFSQLRFDVPQWGTGVDPELLPQVAANNIMRGVYDFELPVAVTPDNNSFTFAPSSLAILPTGLSLPTNFSLPTVSVLNAPTSGLNTPSYGGIGRTGLQLPNYGSIGLFAPVSMGNTVARRGSIGLNMERQSIRAQFMQVSQDNVDARWDLYPNQVIRTKLTDIKGSLPSHISQMEQTLDTSIDVSFRLTPQNHFPTALDLTDDYVKTSPMLNRDYADARLKVTQDNQRLLRESTQQATQRLVDFQQQQQNRLYQRNRALQQQRR